MKSLFIYEVNIQVAEPLYKEYLLWLKAHIKDMLALPYFNGADLYTAEGFDGEPLTLKVHYHLVSRDSLDQYLAKDAQKMRSQLPESWLAQLTIHRKLLEQQ